MSKANSLLYILEAEFYEFRGFSKPRIKLLAAQFKQKLQILNSTNGCGKSTFISELNPFPINKTLFKKKGYKRIRFIFGDKTYEVYSSHKTNKLIDMDDPETNLCTGGTISQLNTLLENLFGIDIFGWAIAMGAIEFTAAPKEIRRKWIERISGIDLDYPFKVLGKLISQNSAAKSTHKHLVSQLAVEAEKLLKYEDVIDAINYKDILAADIKQILMTRGMDIDPRRIRVLECKIKELEAECKTVYMDYTKLADILNPFANVNSTEGLREEYRARKGRIDVINVELTGLVSFLADRNGMLKRIEEAGTIDIKAIREQIEYHKTLMADSRNRCSIGRKLINMNLRTAETAFIFCNATDKLEFNFTEEVMSLLGDAGDDAFELKMPEDARGTLIAAVEDAGFKLTSCANRIISTTEILNHLKSSCKDIDCPNCHTTFEFGIDKVTKAEQQLDKLVEFQSVNQPRLDKLIAELEEVNSVYATRTRVITFLKERFKDYGWWVSDLTLMIESGCSVSSLYSTMRSDSAQAYSLDIGISSTEELRRLNGLEEAYVRINELTDLENLDKDVMEINGKIGILRAERRVLESDMLELTRLGTLAERHVTMLINLRDALLELDSSRKEYLKILEGHTLELMERDLQLRLAEVTKRVNDNDILVSLVKKLTEMAEDMGERVVVLKVLDKAFNATTGIIGEQLVEYTKAFANQVTDAVSQLWGYPMSVLPCDIEGKKGMSYLFPFDVGGDEPVPDLAFGSKSQKSVINLAIMFCTRMSLKLDRLPLFLDEVGGGFDDTHNIRLGEFIHMLLADYDCSNIFLVHHDVLIRNMLGPHDTVVFDATQVVVEPGYNEFVKIKHF